MPLTDWLPWKSYAQTQKNLHEARENMEEATETMRMLTEAIRTGGTVKSQLPHKEGRIRSITLTEKGKQMFWKER